VGGEAGGYVAVFDGLIAMFTQEIMPIKKVCYKKCLFENGKWRLCKKCQHCGYNL